MIRRIGLMLVWAVGSVGLLLAGTFAVAQTAPGKRLIAELLGRALSSADTTVRLTGLDGLIPFDFRLAQLRMADPQGVWLELDDLRVSASPARLAARRASTSSSSSARRLAVHRLPQGEEAGGGALARTAAVRPAGGRALHRRRPARGRPGGARPRCGASDCPAACGPARPAARRTSRSICTAPTRPPPGPRSRRA